MIRLTRRNVKNNKIWKKNISIFLFKNVHPVRDGLRHDCGTKFKLITSLRTVSANAVNINSISFLGRPVFWPRISATSAFPRAFIVTQCRKPFETFSTT